MISQFIVPLIGIGVLLILSAATLFSWGRLQEASAQPEVGMAIDELMVVFFMQQPRHRIARAMVKSDLFWGFFEDWTLKELSMRFSPGKFPRDRFMNAFNREGKKFVDETNIENPGAFIGANSKHVLVEWRKVRKKFDMFRDALFPVGGFIAGSLLSALF